MKLDIFCLLLFESTILYNLYWCLSRFGLNLGFTGYRQEPIKGPWYQFSGLKMSVKVSRNGRGCAPCLPQNILGVPPGWWYKIKLENKTTSIVFDNVFSVLSHPVSLRKSWGLVLLIEDLYRIQLPAQFWCF